MNFSKIGHFTTSIMNSLKTLGLGRPSASKGGFLSASNMTETYLQHTRNSITFSNLSGKRKTVKTVTKRFLRLDWGAWIRPVSGRHKGLWKKGLGKRKFCRYHVFCNAQQSYMFDKMVTKFWRKPKYYVDDIYEPYRNRDNFYITKRH